MRIKGAMGGRVGRGEERALNRPTIMSSGTTALEPEVRLAT